MAVISTALRRGLAAGQSPLVSHASPVQVCQLLEAAAPLVQVVVVLVLTGGRGVEGAEGAPLGAPTLVVKDQQGVVGRRRGVQVSSLQVLGEKGGSRWGICLWGSGICGTSDASSSQLIWAGPA